MKKKIEELKDLFSKRLDWHSSDIDDLVLYHKEFIEDRFLNGDTPLDLFMKFPNWKEKKLK